jgi:glyoxylase-like metal-dependent hydrolase (beta-lactamase superfamily II)
MIIDKPETFSTHACTLKLNRATGAAQETHMETRISEIADGIYRLSTFVPDIAPPAGFTFNQFLVLGDEPLMFHTGLRKMFAPNRDAVSRIIPPERLRWIAYGHFEADECGAMNEWLAIAPQAQAAHGQTGCMVSLNDTADRPPRVLNDGETIDLGGKRVRFIDTPHTPHGWDAGVLYEESTQTLMCGDLFTQLGDGPALTGGDVVGPAIAGEDLFRYSSLNPGMGATIRGLAKLAPRTLALMHGPSFAGDGAAALGALADDYDRRVRATLVDTGFAAPVAAAA